MQVYDNADQSSLIKAVELWSTVEPYSNLASRTIGWRLLTAHRANKIRHYWDGDRYAGFVTWCFLTDQEEATRDFSGFEVFARSSGDNLVVMDLIAPFGRDDVRFIAKDIRAQLSEIYPDVPAAKVWRGPRVGSFARSN